MALLLNLGDADGERFARLVGASGVAALAGGNPVLAVLFIVMMARAYVMARKNGGRRAWAEAVVRGGLLSGLVLTTGALVAGPAWVGIVAGAALAMSVEKVSGRSNFSEIAVTVVEAFRRIVLPWARPAGAG